LNVLITAGGTSEKIDDVRKITNMATGRLGNLIADCFLENEKVSVTYLCSQNAARPKNARARIVPVSDVRSLRQAVEEEMRLHPCDAVIHSMAVSDYTVKYGVSSKRLAAQLAESIRDTDGKQEDLAERIHSALLTCGGEPRTGKISSDLGNLFLCLERTPKIIGLFKKLQPNTILVGFKLLSDVEESELLRAAESLMERNGCDFVLANDRKNIDETRHEAILLEKDHSTTKLGTKTEIARAIKDRVMRVIEDGEKK
jgi:phosphopantothenate-cysteine ligase